jgi:hypothetical protein
VVAKEKWGDVWFSADGHSWKAVQEDDRWALVDYSQIWSDAHRTVAILSQGEFWTTSDGVAWQKLKMSGTDPGVLDNGANRVFVTTGGLIALAAAQGQPGWVALRAVAAR